MAVVGPHPVGRIRGALGLQPDTPGRGFILRMPIEAIVIAAAAEVEKAARSAEKIKGGCGFIMHCVEGVSEGGRPSLVFVDVAQQVEPVGQLMIAQPARTLFDIGFEMEDGVAKFLMARAGQIGKFMDDGAPFAQREPRQRLCLKGLIEAMVAGDETAVEQGEGEFKVSWVVAVAFLEGADHRAGPQAEIPHGLIAAADGLAEIVLHLFVGAKVEEVDVGGREEFLAAEAPDGHQCKPGGQRRTALEPPQRLQQRVDDQGAAADAEHAVAGPVEGLPHGRHLGLVVLSQLLVRRECRFHVGHE